MRRGWIVALGLAIMTQMALAADLPERNIIKAIFSEPTDRYDHGILGDAIEFGALELTVNICVQCAKQDLRIYTIRLPKSRVFEDLSPRLTDLDNDGANEVVVVETALDKGASLAVYDALGKVAQTPFLGQPHRWLAPAGMADFDGDGIKDIALVEKPHLTKEMQIWRYKDRKLTMIAHLGGLTNHRIGDAFISGGVRNCGQGPEIITVDADWARVMATGFKDGNLTPRVMGAFTGQTDLQKALDCR